MRRIPSLLTAIGVNAVPAAGFFLADWSAGLTMLLYVSENIVMALLAALRVALLVPRGGKKGEVIGAYLIVSLGFTGVAGIFAVFFLAAVVKSDFDAGAFRTGLMSIAAFQLFGFISDLFTLRPLPLNRAEKLLEQTLGRVFILATGVFLGVFLAMFVDEWFVVPFIVLKTVIDIGMLFQRAPVSSLAESRRRRRIFADTDVDDTPLIRLRYLLPASGAKGDVAPLPASSFPNIQGWPKAG